MAVWRLHTLGKLSLAPRDESESESDEIRPIGFRNRRTWILLVVLATNPAVCQRDQLAQHLWEETEDYCDASEYRTKLRPILSELIHGDKQKGCIGIGKDSLLCDRVTVKLKHGILITDGQEAASLHFEARSEADENKKLQMLCVAARLLEGEFLPDFDPPLAAQSWYDAQKVGLEKLRYTIWTSLLETARTVGDTVIATEAWQRLQCIETPVAIDTEIEERKRIPKPGKTIKWQTFLRYLQLQERNGLSLTVSEDKALLDSLNARLARLPKHVIVTFQRLCVFPQSFTTRQASAAVGIAETAITESLDCLLEASLLLPQSQEGRKFASEVRYVVPPFVAPLVFQKLSRNLQEKLRKNHALHFVRFDGDGWPHNVVRKDSRTQWIAGERANYMQALEVCLTEPLTEEVLEFLYELRWTVSNVALDDVDSVLQQRTILQRVTSRLQEAAESGQLFFHSPAYLLLFAAKEEQDFTRAIYWANISLEHLRYSVSHNKLMERSENRIVQELVDLMLLLLSAMHHAGRNEDFDKAVKITRDLIPEIGDNEISGDERRLEARRPLHLIQAENSWSRGNLDSAFESNKASLEALDHLVRTIPFLSICYAPTYYQRGCIQWSRGYQKEALANWNEAMEHFQQQNARHGVADCKKRIGKALAEMGHFAVALDLIRESIAIYAVQQNEASRVAALGTFADVLVMRGKFEEARPYYEEGLDYWRTTGHAGWVERFESSLNQLPQLE